MKSPWPSWPLELEPQEKAWFCSERARIWLAPTDTHVILVLKVMVLNFKKSILALASVEERCPNMHISC